MKGKGKRRGRKKRQKLLPLKVVLLILLIAALAGMFVYAWKLNEPKKPAQTNPRIPEGALVCIDPGHGGEDGGASGPDGRLEKEDNLTLALKVQEDLQEQGVSVLMTRTEDKRVSLQGRCDIANDGGADLFVSIHRNSAEAASANGIEIWTATRGKGFQMAEYILAGLKDAGIQTDRGIQSGTSNGSQSDYYVNKHTSMPSCLVEMGFVTNEEDNRLLDKNMDEYAKAIASGVVKMLEDMKKEQEAS